VATDIDRVYRPGETLTIHWIVQGRPVSGAVSTIELHAYLSGPYDSLVGLKGGAAAPATFTAAPVRPAGAAGEQPISTVLIPATALPGYYNLMTSIGGSGFTVSGGSVIQVAAGP
jgi:hypothetical protein